MGILKLLLSYLTIHPSPLRNPSTSLHLSQQAPAFLSSSESAKDTQETWLIYEQLLLSCLRTGDDNSARLCLQRLSDRFGVDSARVKALTGLYDEATSRSRGELEAVLQRYQDILKEDPTNMVKISLFFPFYFHPFTPDICIARRVNNLTVSKNQIADRKAPHITFAVPRSHRRCHQSLDWSALPFAQ